MTHALKSWYEALRRQHEERPDNTLVLDCGHQIFADPNWNEIALASAIREHYEKYHTE
jgi:hypothetical protein